MAGIGPDNGVVEGFAGLFVPYDGGLTLVGDADGLDLANAMALLGESCNSSLDAFLY